MVAAATTAMADSLGPWPGSGPPLPWALPKLWPSGPWVASPASSSAVSGATGAAEVSLASISYILNRTIR